MKSNDVVWITGAHGFIGRHLAQELSLKGKAVYGIGHGAWTQGEAKSSGVTGWLNGEISGNNLSELRALGGEPFCVFHLAGGSSVGVAISQPKEDFTRTVSTTMELLEWVRQQAPHTLVVAVSSAAVYGAGHAGPIPETTIPNPYSPYGYHKLIMESLCRSYGSTFGVRSVIARLFSVYGSGLKKQLLFDLCSSLKRDSLAVVLGGSGGELRDWTDVRDVARILGEIVPMAAMDAPVLNVGRGQGVSVGEVAAYVVRSWAEGVANYAKVSFSGITRTGDPFSLIAETTKQLRGELVCEISPEAGIADYVSWFKREYAA